MKFSQSLVNRNVPFHTTHPQHFFLRKFIRSIIHRMHAFERERKNLVCGIISLSIYALDTILSLLVSPFMDKRIFTFIFNCWIICMHARLMAIIDSINFSAQMVQNNRKTVSQTVFRVHNLEKVFTFFLYQKSSHDVHNKAKKKNEEFSHFFGYYEKVYLSICGTITTIIFFFVIIVDQQSRDVTALT